MDAGGLSRRLGTHAARDRDRSAASGLHLRCGRRQRRNRGAGNGWPGERRGAPSDRRGLCSLYSPAPLRAGAGPPTGAGRGSRPGAQGHDCAPDRLSGCQYASAAFMRRLVDAWLTSGCLTRMACCCQRWSTSGRIYRLSRQKQSRCSRLVRKTLSFSKKLANHIGALSDFIHDYNAILHAWTIRPPL